MPSITDVRELLHEVSEMLTWKLSEVLKRFEPNDFMTEQLEEFIVEWGERPFHEFLVHIKTLSTEDCPDVLNGQMKPLNIFWILDEFYPEPERAAPS